MGTEAETEFATNGAIVVRGLFDDQWVETLRCVADELLGSLVDPSDRLGGAATAPALSSDGVWRRDPAFARFLARSPIADAAGAAMASELVALYEDLFLYTDPEQAGAPWHRDAPHWPLMGDQLCSVWFSLEPVPIDGGALHFVAGSHRDQGEVVASESMVLDGAPEKDREVFGFGTEPGDAIVFHPRILHSAIGAAPERPRRTFTVRFVGDDVRWRPRSSYYHPWMRDLDLERGDRLQHPWFPVLRGRP